MKPIKKFVNNTTNEELHIFQDESPENPNDWDNDEIFLVYDHRQFTVERKGFAPKDIFEYKEIQNQTMNEDENDIEDIEWEYDNYYIFTVYAHIHSGVVLSLAHNGDRFDTSSTGFILVDKTKFDFKAQISLTEDLTGKTDKEIAKHYAEGLIKNWNTYLSGEVYGFKRFEKLNVLETIVHNTFESFKSKGYNIPKQVIEDSLDKQFIEELQINANNNMKETDSCWGYYGIESIFDEIDKEHWEEIKNE